MAGVVVSSGRGNTSLTYHCRPSLTAAPYAQPEYQTPTFYTDNYLQILGNRDLRPLIMTVA